MFKKSNILDYLNQYEKERRMQKAKLKIEIKDSFCTLAEVELENGIKIERITNIFLEIKANQIPILHLDTELLDASLYSESVDTLLHYKLLCPKCETLVDISEKNLEECGIKVG